MADYLDTIPDNGLLGLIGLNFEKKKILFINK